MPVDDRLRGGLEAAALEFVPEAERRLAAVHRRHRRRMAGTAAGVAAAVALVVVAVGGTIGSRDDSRAPDPAGTPTTTSSTAPEWTGDVIPDSTWTRIASSAEARRLGLGRDAIVSALGTDGRIPLTLRIEDRSWSQSGVYSPGGPAEVGDFGTLEYDAQGRLVTTSDSPGCPGCRATVRWRITDDRLVLALVPGSADGPVDPIARLMVEGTWQRVER